MATASAITLKTATALAAGETKYIVPGSDVQATYLAGYAPNAVAGTFSKLYVELSAAPGASESVAVTFVKSTSPILPSDQALTATVSDAATTANDTSNSVAMAAGHQWSIKMVSSASAASAQVAVAMVFTPD